MRQTGMKSLFLRSSLQIVRRPVYWFSMLVIPLLFIVFLCDMMKDGLPSRVPAAIVDLDLTNMSRSMTQNLDGMQMVSIDKECDSYAEANRAMQQGEIFGFFLIPENFQSDLLAGRQPVITFYTNMAYYVPASLLFKTFKTTAVYSKAGIAMEMLAGAGAPETMIAPMLQPVNISTRGLGNPQLNYAIYLCNSFIPAMLQLMIMLVTCFTICSEIKYHTSQRLMQMADGSVIKAVIGKLLPESIVWIVIAIFMESWMFKWQGFPMHGSWLWITLSEILFVFATQSFALFVCCLLPNLRLSLSVAALTGVLTFSVAAYSFPVESMYGGIAIFSWVMPARYNLLIYIDQALNGIDIYYSRYWFVAYIIYILLPYPFIRRLRKAWLKPVYVP